MIRAIKDLSTDSKKSLCKYSNYFDCTTIFEPK